MQIGKYTLVDTSEFNKIKDEAEMLKHEVEYYKEWLSEATEQPNIIERYEKMMRLLTKFYIMIICVIVAALLIRYYIKNS